MTFRKRGFRAMVLGLVVAAGLALTPAAFARDHFGIGIALPGVSIGVGNGWGHRGYVDVGVGGYYAPAYYAPAPVYYDAYPGYYGPAYYGAVYGGPVVYGSYYGGGRGYYRGGHYYGGHGGYSGGHASHGGGGYYHH